MSPIPLQAGPLLALDYLGIAVFALSGALVAAEKRQNVVTFAFFAAATGIGGGTLRDLLIGAPVFWVHQNTFLVVCLGAAVVVWFGAARFPGFGRALPWLDAVGLIAYSIYGTEKALRYGIAPVPASVMGILTACAGGILRDVLAERPSILLRPEVYVSAAALSAGLYMVLILAGLAPVAAALLAGLSGFGLRGAAIVHGLHLPSHPGPRRPLA